MTYREDDGIAHVVINRAERMNALNEDVIQGLRSAWLAFQASPTARVAILSAAGDRAFSVGADIRQPPKEMWQGVPSVGVEVDKPIIAAVHGWCIGGAYVIVQMCDLVVASTDTTFKYPEAQLGFTGGLIAGCAARIPHKIAMEFMLLGEDLGAQRAYDVGMVNRLAEPGRQVEVAMEMATILRHSAPLVTTTLKRFVLELLPRGPAELAALARDRLLRVSTSEDGREGGRAFAEKRTPRFTGR